MWIQEVRRMFQSKKSSNSKKANQIHSYQYASKAPQSKPSKDPEQTSGKSKAVLFLILAALPILLLTVVYLDVFGLRAMLFSEKEMDPILRVRMPADEIELKLASAKSARLFDEIPPPAEGTMDIFVKNGLLQVSENGNSNVLEGSDPLGGYKLAFSYSEAAPDSLNFLIGSMETSQYDMMRSARVGRIVGTPGTSYAAVRIYFSEAGLAAISSVDNLSFNIQNGAAFQLPATVKATLADGSVLDAPVTWSPSSIDTAENGVRGSLGKIDGYEYDITLTLVISDLADGKLPDDTAGSEAGDVVSASVPAPVPKPAQPVASEPTQPAAPAPKPAPKPAPTISALQSISATVRQGDAYTMPTTVTATMSDGTRKNVTVKWNPVTLDTLTAGTKTSKGSVSGTTRTATLTLTVTQSTLAAPKVAVSKISGTDATVRVTGKTGATVLFNGGAVGTIGSEGILTVNGVNIDTLQNVRLTMDGWDPSPSVTTFVLF